ncbi:transporter [Streptomyces melanosporofaciens]|uniref:ABC-2 type transport system permease protein n=1 Tax=Streptomyces melanosporofaciens TaxID=67327 RepID=A0A1H4PRN0_STRMJ|nr:transporter [Streptomyces melanosporofaciens]SEC09914.1 ABC-2 type transport system permease protein [Streptomyces melanosporofaciens]
MTLTDPLDAKGPLGTAAPAPPAAPTTSPTPVFVSLKLALLRNGLRQSSGRRAAYITSLVLALLFAVLQLLGLVLLRDTNHVDALVTLLTAVLALGWAVMPLFFPGGDETLDPTRLVMLPLRPRSLITALLVSSLIGIGPLFTLTLAAGSAVAVAHGAAAAGAAVVAVVLTVLVCVALARAVATANTRLLTSRKGRDLAVLSGLFVAIGAQFVNLGAQRLGGENGLAVLEPAAAVLRWVPPAAAVDAVQGVSDGAYGVAAAQFALTIGALAVLLWWWRGTLTHLMTTPDASTLQAAAPRERRGSGAADTPDASGPFARLLPAGRSGTVLLRTLRYAVRDPKTKSAWATSLGVGLLLPFVTAVQDNGSVYWSCWASGMLGMLMYNQFGQDSSAFWMVAQTISSPRDAYLELRGRTLALLLVAVPYMAVAVLGSAAVLKNWSAAPEALGIALALLGSMLATGAMASALAPYSIPQDSGYKNVAPGQAGIAWISLLVGMIVGSVLCAPVLGLTIWLHVSGAHGWLWVVLPLGAVYGAALAETGLRLAAPRVAARLPEILAAVNKG